jgi:cytochrome c5
MKGVIAGIVAVIVSLPALAQDSATHDKLPDGKGKQ